MVNMIPWEQRSTDIANLLNPAFGSVLIRKFIEGFEDKSNSSVPFILCYTVLPVILHSHTRKVLPSKFNPHTKLLTILRKNPEFKVELPNRIISIKPISKESILFGLQNNLFTIANNGEISSVGKKIKNTVWEKDSEPSDCFKKAELFGRLLGVTSDVSTICIMLGIAP